MIDRTKYKLIKSVEIDLNNTEIREILNYRHYSNNIRDQLFNKLKKGKYKVRQEQIK